MAGEWVGSRLGDLITVRHGWPFKSELCSDKLSGRPIVINIGNYRYTGGFRFDSTNVREYQGEYPREYELSPGEILLVMTCQTFGGEILGIPARVPNDGRTYLHNQRLGRVVVTRPDLIDESFLYWLFLSSSFNRELFLSATGTKILHTAPSRIEAVRFRLPSLVEQRAIAHILGTLDDKIELNRRTNETLEAMARAIFKSWFVDFDPVHAKAERRDPGLSKDISDLFPDRFEDSELGEIPVGWEVNTLGDILELAYGKALKEEERKPGEVPVFGSNGQVGRHNQRLAAGPGIVVGRKGNPGTVTWAPTDFFAIDTTFYVVPKGNCRSPYFLFHALGNHDLPSLSADSAVPGLNRNLAYMNKQVVPGRTVLEKFDEQVRPLFYRVHRNYEESRTLAAVRDALLPKLLSGELRVAGHEQFLEAMP